MKNQFATDSSIGQKHFKNSKFNGHFFIMFVSVYLIDARVHTVVPREFIFELNKVNLYNNGVNSNQNRLIYFSKVLFEALEIGNDTAPTDYIPNFSVPVTKVYPLPSEVQETCFIGRLKKFWGN